MTMETAIPAYSRYLFIGALLAVLYGTQAMAAQETEPGQVQPPEAQPIVTEEPEPAPQPQESPSSWTAPVAMPSWTLEIKGGHFESDLEDWENFYGGDRSKQAGLLAGYKFFRQFEAGMAVDYIHDKGIGFLPINGKPGGEVDFQLYPVHLYVMWRGVFFEDQWVVPYVGAGATRVYYRQKIQNQSSVRGDVDGDHNRAGLQILLDWLDTGSASGFEEEGIENTYLTVEVLSFSAELEGIELGGKSTMIGLAFEF
jgi:opacity protein-like surface antigen